MITGSIRFSYEDLLEYLKVYRQLRVLDCLFIGDKSGDVPYAIEEDKVAEFLKQHIAPYIFTWVLKLILARQENVRSSRQFNE